MCISKKLILEIIAESENEMSSEEKIFWNLVKISPKKWNNYYFSKEGREFWGVGILGKRVLWYNDIEDGFNISKYSKLGIIDEYCCNQDELDIIIRRLLMGKQIIKLEPPVPFTITPVK